MKQALKATAAVVGIAAAGALLALALYSIMWAAHYAGIRM